MPSDSYYEPPDDYNQDNYYTIEDKYFTWKSREGDIHISNMTDRHLSSAIAYIKNKQVNNLYQSDDNMIIKFLLMKIELLERKIKTYGK